MKGCSRSEKLFSIEFVGAWNLLTFQSLQFPKILIMDPKFLILKNIWLSHLTVSPCFSVSDHSWQNNLNVLVSHKSGARLIIGTVTSAAINCLFWQTKSSELPWKCQMNLWKNVFRDQMHFHCSLYLIIFQPVRIQIWDFFLKTLYSTKESHFRYINLR